MDGARPAATAEQRNYGAAQSVAAVAGGGGLLYRGRSLAGGARRAKGGRSCPHAAGLRRRSVARIPYAPDHVASDYGVTGGWPDRVRRTSRLVIPFARPSDATVAAAGGG